MSLLGTSQLSLNFDTGYFQNMEVGTYTVNVSGSNYTSAYVIVSVFLYMPGSLTKAPFFAKGLDTLRMYPGTEVNYTLPMVLDYMGHSY